MLRGSDAAQLAIATAVKSPALTQRLGEPLKAGWLVTGNIQVSPGSGHAELAFPISGPKGAGTVYVEARKQSGIWHLRLLQFGNDSSNDRLNLLPQAATSSEPASITEQ